MGGVQLLGLGLVKTGELPYTSLATASDGDGGEGHGGRQMVPHSSSGVLSWYIALLGKYPVQTKAITAALVNFLGDIFTQLVIEKSGRINPKRTAVITVIGAIIVGPTLHAWYLFLSKIVKVGGAEGAAMGLVLDRWRLPMWYLWSGMSTYLLLVPTLHIHRNLLIIFLSYFKGIDPHYRPYRWNHRLRGTAQAGEGIRLESD